MLPAEPLLMLSAILLLTSPPAWFAPHPAQGVKSPSMSRRHHLRISECPETPENPGMSGDAVMSRFSESQPNPTGAAHGLARI